MTGTMKLIIMQTLLFSFLPDSCVLSYFNIMSYKSESEVSSESNVLSITFGYLFHIHIRFRDTGGPFY